MRIGVIVQARMNSARLPGKVLKEISGKPILKYLLESLEHCRFIDVVIVSTSVENFDSDIVDFCKKNGVNYFRGSLRNVAARFKDTAQEYKLDSFVRVTADSPLLDCVLVDKATEIFRNSDFEIVTNVLERTYPKGESVEVLKTESFLEGYAQMNSQEDLEHVTKYFYRNHQNFRISNFALEKDYSDMQLSVDTQQDFESISKVISIMNRPHWQYEVDEIIGMYKELFKCE